MYNFYPPPIEDFKPKKIDLKHMQKHFERAFISLAEYEKTIPKELKILRGNFIKQNCSVNSYFKEAEE